MVNILIKIINMCDVGDKESNKSCHTGSMTEQSLIQLDMTYYR